MNAEDLYAELQSMIGTKVALLPSWEALPHEKLSPAVDTVARRRQALQAVRDGAVKVRGRRGALAGATHRGRLCRSQYCGHFGAPGAGLSDLVERLVHHGYSHVDMVGRRGQFAVRGGIVDVFAATEDMPVRIELWGDEVTEIRAFSPADQRTIGEIEVAALDIFACRALLIDDSVKQAAENLASERTGAIQEMLTRISEGQWVEGMEALIPLLSPHPTRMLPEIMPSGTLTLMCAPRADSLPRRRPYCHRRRIHGCRLEERRHGWCGSPLPPTA